MKLKDLKAILADVEDSHGVEAEVFFETPKGNTFTPNEDEGWYDGDEDDDFPANSVVIPVKAV